MHRTEEQIERKSGEKRSAGTGIYFLLPSGVCTNWHRVNSDEAWHFYSGDKLILEIISAEEKFHQKILFNEFSDETTFQAVVPRNCWQRAYSTGEYSLVGCSVSPGFEFEDFEMINQEKLAGQILSLKSKIIYDPFDKV